MQKTLGWTEWRECDRCGHLYPIAQLTKQKGLFICTATCFDNTDVEMRAKIIGQVLSSDEPKQDTLPRDAGEVSF